jgi:hypothetical protein
MLSKILSLDCDAASREGTVCEAVGALLNVGWELKLVESAKAARIRTNVRVVLTLVLFVLFLVHLAQMLLAAPYDVTTRLQPVMAFFLMTLYLLLDNAHRTPSMRATLRVLPKVVVRLLVKRPSSYSMIWTITLVWAPGFAKA